MDAYTDAMMRLSDARLADLCREAARDRLAAGFRRRTTRAAARLVDAHPVAGVSPLPAPSAAEPLRRTA
ncbi:MAG: hypothetical protein QOG43_3011 [Actinomycetota bacterium]|jgi:hypothetical protein|nr:hypothetical protein [Actinomycetota bacterium]